MVTFIASGPIAEFYRNKFINQNCIIVEQGDTVKFVFDFCKGYLYEFKFIIKELEEIYPNSVGSFINNISRRKYKFYINYRVSKYLIIIFSKKEVPIDGILYDEKFYLSIEAHNKNSYKDDIILTPVAMYIETRPSTDVYSYNIFFVILSACVQLVENNKFDYCGFIDFLTRYINILTDARCIDRTKGWGENFKYKINETFSCKINEQDSINIHLSNSYNIVKI